MLASIFVLFIFVPSGHGQSLEMTTKVESVQKLREQTRQLPGLDKIPMFPVVAPNIISILREGVSELTDDVTLLAKFARAFGLVL